VRPGVGKAALALRAERVERSFALALDRGGLRRIHARGRENVQKRYLVPVAGHDLGLVMRQLIGAGTPKEVAARGARLRWLLDPDIGLLALLIPPPEAGPEPTSSTACQPQFRADRQRPQLSPGRSRMRLTA
jgi:transposase